jgi:type IV secretion system protein VirB6
MLTEDNIPLDSHLYENNTSSHLRYLVMVILFYMTLSCHTSAFANFGQSCSGLPISPLDNYLMINTAYGHLIGNIDMSTYVTDPCNPDNEQLKLCLRLPTGSTAPCALLTLNVGDTIRLGDVSTNPALGGSKFLKDIVLNVTRTSNYICLNMPTSRGVLPIACKTTNVSGPQSTPQDTSCRTIGNSCYDGHVKSQSIFNFSGLAVYCLSETLDKIFYQRNNCIADKNDSLSLLSPFPVFQESLKTAIRAALILYVMFYGFKVVMNYEYADLNKVAMFIIKFILVVYFAVGLGPIFFNKEGLRTTQNGMLEYALPFLSKVAPTFAEIVFDAGSITNLCKFDKSKYAHGYEFYELWDSIDCRIAYYFGMQIGYNISTLLSSASGSVHSQSNNVASSPIDLGPPGANGLNVLQNTIFPFFVVLFGFIMSGNIIIVVAGVIFAIIFVSIVLHFLTSYLVCLITLYVMAYISPIFISMALFERTKAYFDSWLRITLSCALQPAVLAGFIALLLTMFDSAMYKNCQFLRHDYTYQDVNFSTFELRIPDLNSEECKGSAGYKLLKYYIGQGWEKHKSILFSVKSLKDTLSLVIDFIYVLVFTMIFYFFSRSMSQFAADITSGPLMSGVTSGPTRIIDAARNLASFIQNARRQDFQSLSSNTAKSAAKDLAPKGRSGGVSEDKASTGQANGEAKDSVSTSSSPTPTDTKGSGGGV